MKCLFESQNNIDSCCMESLSTHPEFPSMAEFRNAVKENDMCSDPEYLKKKEFFDQLKIKCKQPIFIGY